MMQKSCSVSINEIHLHKVRYEAKRTFKKEFMKQTEFQTKELKNPVTLTKCSTSSHKKESYLK